jgi:hypothetical protein
MEEILLAVNGSLMRGFALNINLLAVNAEFVCDTKTVDQYRIWSIKDQYPAMQRILCGGNCVDVEIWKMTPEALLKILKSEPPGLCLGKVQLADGEWVFGILGESYICIGMTEITEWGGWRDYLSQKSTG